MMSLETFEKLPDDKKDWIIGTGIRAFSQKSYKDVSTDSITQQCQISKGLLFHYFGSKKAYYLYCLEKAMARLTEKTEPVAGADFYEILFSSMNRKMSLCVCYRDEMHMVNMASRDPSAEIAAEKAAVLRRYMADIHLQSAEILKQAISQLDLKDAYKTPLTTEGLHLYINAVLNKYLLAYQQTPDRFFENSEQIKIEMKEYLDMMLRGICQ